MNDSDSSTPQGPGRRAQPADEIGGQAVAPRRGIPVEEHIALPSGPRRAAPSTPEEDERYVDQPWFRGGGGWVVGIATVLIALALWAVLPPSAEAPPVVVPSSIPATTTTAATPSPPTASADDSTTAPATPVPTHSTPPLPGTESAPPPVTAAPPEPSPDSSTTAGLVELNDASFTAPESWTLYGDELIEEDRRAVRLSNEATDARLQAVTLVPGGTSDLSQSCRSLVDLQKTQFTDPTRDLVVPIGVGASSGAGVRCGFSGVRTSDGVDNTVTFTLVSRATDSHVLMLRTTVPDSLTSDSPAISQLTSMSCQASASFGVALPLC